MRRWSISRQTLVIASVIIAYLFLMWWRTKAPSGTFVSSAIQLPGDTAFGGLFAKPRINDSLPHYLYQRIADSLKRIDDERLRENSSEMESSLHIASLGIYSTEIQPPKNVRQELFQYQMALRDSLSDIAHKKMAATTNKDSIQLIKDQLKDTLADYYSHQKREYLYYLGLQGYTLDKESKFFVQNGTYNLAVPKWDDEQNFGNNAWRHGHYVRKQIPVRYAARDKLLLIPVSKQNFNILNIVMGVLSFSMLFFYAYCLLGLPLLILINISKGRAFDDINIKRFAFIARMMLGWMLVKILSPYILWFCYRKMIPDDFILPNFPDLLWDNGQLFIIGIAIFITGKAFQKGNDLQKEQDLTI